MDIIEQSRVCFHDEAIFKQFAVFLWKPIWHEITKECFIEIYRIRSIKCTVRLVFVKFALKMLSKIASQLVHS